MARTPLLPKSAIAGQPGIPSAGAGLIVRTDDGCLVVLPVVSPSVQSNPSMIEVTHDGGRSWTAATGICIDENSRPVRNFVQRLPATSDSGGAVCSCREGGAAAACSCNIARMFAGRRTQGTDRRRRGIARGAGEPSGAARAVGAARSFGAAPALSTGRALVTILPALCLLAASATLVTRAGSRPAWAGGVGADQARVASLRQQIAAQGSLLQTLVSRYDQAQSHERQLEAQIARTKSQLAADRVAQSKAEVDLRRLAVDWYISGSETSSFLQMFEGSSITSSMAGQEYSQVANAGLQDAIDSVKNDEHHSRSAEVLLGSEVGQTRTLLKQLAASRSQAQAALAKDDALLASAKGNLQTLLAAVDAQRAAAERAQEEAMAQQAAAAAAAAQNPVTPGPTASPGSYTNPLQMVSYLSLSRIDQGVDYCGSGPILALGDGVVLSTYNSGWPGGTFITYRLTDGPAAGLVVYAAEDIYPSVSTGQTVTTGSAIGTMYEGSSCIETGWADPSGDGVTMAYDYGQYSGGNTTAFGANFSQLLGLLGAPQGIMQNNPPTGSLPPNWPQW